MKDQYQKQISAVSGPGRIMIIDDDAFSLKLLSNLVHQAGHTAYPFTSVSKAILEIPNLQPEMVLLDVQMEEMDGFTACQTILESSPARMISVIFVTGETDPAQTVRGFEAGGVDYLKKPINRAELLARLNTHLSLGRLKTQLEMQNEHLLAENEERRQLEALLRESEEKFRAIATSAQDAIVIIDRRGKILFWNPAAENIFGYNESDVIGQNLHSILSPNMPDPVNAETVPQEFHGHKYAWDAAIKELMATRRDGTELPIELSRSSATIQGEQVMVGIMRDITLRKRLMSQIEQGKREWEAVFDSVTDMIFLTDEQGKVMRCNRAALERLNVDQAGGNAWQHVLQKPISVLLMGDGESCCELSETKEAQFPKLEGWFEVSLYPVYTSEGTMMKVYLFKDISVRKKMEGAMLASQKMASLGTLVAGIAHEINSPLQVITGISQSLSDQIDQNTLDLNRLKRSLGMIYRNGWRVAEIVRALRTYAHTSEHNFESANLNEIIKDTLLLIEHQLESWSNITISTEYAADLSEMVCDREKITQVLINLLTNSRDAMPAGGEISICTSWDPVYERVTLVVRDNGIGIPEEILARIFDPFYTTKPLGEGTGLGLSIVQGVIRSHQGEIKVESQLNRGTTFTLSFPGQPVLPMSSYHDSVDGTEGRFDDATAWPQTALIG